MPNPVGDISKIQLPSGDEYNIKDTVSGYSKVFKINVTSSSNTYSADKTYSEIVSAYESGEYDLILVSEEATNDEYVAPLQTYDSTHDILTFICVCDESRSGAVASGNKNIIRKYQIEDDETVTVSESILPPFMTILSYGHNTWQDFLDAYDNNAIVYCRASSQLNPASGNQTRMAFMAYVNASPPTEVEFQYYRSRNGHTDNYQGDQVYVYKLNSSGTWSVTVRNAYTKMIAGVGLTGTYANATVDSVASQGTLTFKTKLKSETKLTNGASAATEVANRVYPVAVDKDGYLAVNVPWTDTTGVTDVTVNSTSIVSSGVANLVTSTSHPYDPSTNPLATVDDVSSSGGGTVTDVQVNGTSVLSSGVANLVTNTAYNASSNKIATMSDVPTVTSTYSSTGTNAVNGTAVNAALQTLDSSITAETGKAISAFTITDGQISAATKIAVGDANQNAFSNVKVGSSTIAADTTTDTLELIAGNNITLTPNATNDSVTIEATGGSSVSPYASNPAMDGTASAGSSNDYARGDHVHPSDTSKVNKSGDTMTGNLTITSGGLDSLGGMTAGSQTGTTTVYNSTWTNKGVIQFCSNADTGVKSIMVSNGPVGGSSTEWNNIVNVNTSNVATFYGSGSGLGSLNASNLATGTVPAARLQLKTINNESLTGSGNITAGGGDVGHDDTVTTGSAVTINADTLQGYQASAFVKTADVDEVAYYTADTVASGVKQLHVGIEMELLWTNSSPTSSFAAQTIQVNMTDYKLIIIDWNAFADGSTISKEVLTLATNNMNGVGQYVTTSSTANGNMSLRRFTTNMTSIIFEAGLRSDSDTADNARMIPYKIYGIR